MIEFNIVEVEVSDFDSKPFVLWLQEVVELEQKILGEISFIFCNDEYLLKINQDYLQHDYYTDIISFDYSEGLVVSGDLFISIERVKENAVEFNVSFLDELKRVCVHGVLHLCGYKDKNEDEIKLMREKENLYLEKYVSRETKP